MFLIGEIEFGAPGHSISTRRGIWLSVNTSFTDVQMEEIGEELGLWLQPGILRSLGLRRAKPVIQVKEGRPGNLRLIFRALHCQKHVVRSIRSQKELAQIVANALDWNGFRFRHVSSAGAQDVAREFTAQRPCGGAPWEWQEHIATVPQVPHLSRSYPRQ